MEALEDKSAYNWHNVLLQLLAPLVRFALRHGLKVQQIESALSESMVVEAQALLTKQAKQHSTSRLSVMTGIHRRQISRQLEGSSSDHDSSLIAKVLGLWQHGKRYRAQDNKPRQLSVGYVDADFNQLVREVNRELNPAAVLFELERVGAVSICHIDGKDFATLIKGTFSPSDRFNSGIGILSSDIDDLLYAVEENLVAESTEKNLHARTVFDNVQSENVAELKRWIRMEGHEFHRRLREKLAELDNDINPQADRKGTKLTVTVGSFGRIVER
jgi:hypothetical protein